MLQGYKQIVKSLICPLLMAMICFGQQVRVPNAQRLVDELMARHPEMQTIGIHLTPPGWTHDLNIAGSKPGKVGKLSADLDIEVARTGKPSLRLTPKGAFDMGLPLHDASGRPIGMVVIVIRETFTTSQSAARERAATIRDELQARIPSMHALLDHAALVPSKVAMIVQTPLPDTAEDLGYFALDRARDRLYLFGGHHTFVFNRNGDLLENETAPPAASVKPQVSGLWFDAERNRIYSTAPDGLAVYIGENGNFRLDSKYPIMHSTVSFYDPERSYLYAAHSKNAEDGAALQIYKVE